jgi:uncharacterized membrane protein
MSASSEVLQPVNASRGVENAVRLTLTVIAVAVLCAGVLLRFHALTAHGFWADEGISALHAAGYTRDDVLQAYRQSGTLTAGQLRNFELPAASTSASSTVRALASEDSQHPPLYYLMLRGWEHVAGTPVARMRLLSAITGVLLIPAMYWLCLLLFRSAVIALVGAALVAISPYHVEFSQNTREYALWALLTAVSTGVLLSAIRSRGYGLWVLYAVLAALGLYCHTFFAFVMLAHLVFVAVRAYTKRSGRDLGRYVAAAVVAGIVYAPWAIVILRHLSVSQQGVGGFAATAGGAKGVVFSVFETTAQPFFDLLWIDARWVPLTLAAVGLAIWGLYAVAEWAPRRAAALIGALVAVCALLFVASGHVNDVPSRYLVPFILAVEMAVAFLIGSGATTGSTSKRVAFVALFAAVCAAGLFSVWQRPKYVAWWDSGYGEPLLPVAAIVDAQPHALVVGDPKTDWATSMDLSRFVREDVRFAMYAPGMHLKSGTLLLSRAPALAQEASAYHLQPLAVRVPGHGWQLVKDLEQRKVGQLQPVTWLWRVGPGT